MVQVGPVHCGGVGGHAAPVQGACGLLVVTSSTVPVPDIPMPLNTLPAGGAALAGGTNTEFVKEPPVSGLIAMVNPPADTDRQFVSDAAEGMTVLTMKVSPTTTGL